MSSSLSFFADNKNLLLIALAFSVCKGIFLGDFRYGLFSVVIIQILFPLALFLIFAIGESGSSKYLMPLLAFLGCILVAESIGMLSYYFSAGLEESKNPVTIALRLGSILGQIGFF